MLVNFIYEHNIIYWMYTTLMYFQIFVVLCHVSRGKRNSILFEVVLEFALLTLIRTSQVD